MRKEKLPGICAAMGMLLLILDTKTALRGASEGINLCLGSVIPSLFPFFAVSIYLTGFISGRQFKSLRILGKLCRIPHGSESLLLIGLLGGYPTGAQSVAQSYEAGQLAKTDSRRMLGFCNNAGPAFLFGILAGKFPQMWFLWALWGIHIFSSIIVGMLLPGKALQNCTLTGKQPFTLIQSVKKAVANTAMVCAWIILFRVILSFLDRWLLWLLPIDGQIAILGILELANGCCELEYIQDLGLRFLVCAGMLGLGGVCVTLQTASVTSSLGLGWYIPGKILQTLVSVILASIVVYFFLPENQWPSIFGLYPAAAVLSVGIIMIFIRKKENKCRNTVTSGV